MQLQWKHQFQFAGYYAALEKGYYRDAGLDVHILEAPADVEPAQRVIQGKAEFGIATSDLLLLRSKSYPVVALAAIYQHSPLILLASRQSGIESIHDLADKRVMMEPNAAELLAYLQSEGIPSGKMTIMPHTFDPSALIEGQADAMSAYSTDEPFLLQQAGVDYLAFTPRAGGIDFYGDTLFTTEAQIRDHPERVKDFLAASLLGWQYALDHPDEIIDLILSQYSQRHSRQHLEFEAQMTRKLIIPDVVEIGYMNPGRWRNIADTYADLGMVPPHFSLDGFLYDRNPQPDLRWIYLTIAGVLVALGIVSLIATRFYQLNTLIRRQIVEKNRMEAVIRAAEERYRFLAENAPFPTAITRLADNSVRYINQRAAQKLEIAKDYVVGKPVRELYDNPEDREKLLVLVHRSSILL